jgi:hypothetical protein
LGKPAQLVDAGVCEVAVPVARAVQVRGDLFDSGEDGDGDAPGGLIGPVCGVACGVEDLVGLVEAPQDDLRVRCRAEQALNTLEDRKVEQRDPRRSLCLGAGRVDVDRLPVGDVQVGRLRSGVDGAQRGAYDAGRAREGDRVGLGIDTANFSGNVVNLTLTATYTLGVVRGSLTVTPTAPPAVADNSEDIEVSWWDKFIGLGNDVDKIETARTNLNASLIDATTGLATQVQQLLNGTAGWIYPGGQTFLFHDVAFSTEQDLVVRVVYADPGQPSMAAVTAAAPVTA